MKIHSKALAEFLRERGVSEASPTEIARMKKEYRRLWKQAWKQRQKKTQKEIRFFISQTEHTALTLRADIYRIAPTTYAKGIIRDHVGSAPLLPEKDTLLKILQAISMASIALSGCEKQVPESIREDIYKAESLLTGYLQGK